MSKCAVTVTVSGPVASGKSMILTEIEAALKVAGAEVVWETANVDREHDLMSPATMAARGLEMPRVTLVEVLSPKPGERIMRDLTPAQKKVFAAVPSDHESSSNGIKNRCGLGQRTVYDSLRSLERKGLVSRPNHRLFWIKTEDAAS